MERWLILLPCPAAHVRKFSKWHLTNRNRSSIGSVKPTIGCENLSDSTFLSPPCHLPVPHHVPATSPRPLSSSEDKDSLRTALSNSSPVRALRRLFNCVVYGSLIYWTVRLFDLHFRTRPMRLESKTCNYRDHLPFTGVRSI